MSFKIIGICTEYRITIFFNINNSGCTNSNGITIFISHRIAKFDIFNI